jgi:hypothetical protein
MKKFYLIIKIIVFFLFCFNEGQTQPVTSNFNQPNIRPALMGAWLSVNYIDTLKHPVTVSLKRVGVTNSADNEPKQQPEKSDSEVKPMSLFEFQLSIIVLSFGFLIVLIEVFLIKTRRISSEDSIKFITITLIITSTLFLITAGYSNNQIAPAVGLLGTIAGYLLGKMNTAKNDEKN